MKAILTLLVSASLTLASYGQASSPFAGCQNLAIARSGNNTYANQPVSIYKINTTTGAASIIPGSIKDPANNANNLDINAVGLNNIDGYLYAMSPVATTSPKFYRIGSNYSIAEVGVIQPPINGSSQGIVNAAAGEMDNAGNYFLSAVTGTFNFLAGTFTPNNFYLGKLSNVAGLTAGSTNLTPAYTALDFSSPACSEYLASISAPMSSTTASNTGLMDMTFNATTDSIYTYVIFESPAGSGVFKGQLLSISSSNGTVTGYPLTTLSFASASNMVAGVLTIAGGNNIEILLTQGDMYQADFSGTGKYTGGITFLGSSSITGGLRGDLASNCTPELIVTPVKFESFTVSENECRLNYQWTVSQEENVKNYNLQLMDNSGSFKDVVTINATNNTAMHSYSTLFDVTNKTMSARVKQTDIDGKFTYSKILLNTNSCQQTKSVTIVNSASVTDKLQVRWNNFNSNTPMSMAVYSASGEKVLQQNLLVTAFANITTIPLLNIAKGTYFFTAVSNNGDKYSASFLKK